MLILFFNISSQNYETLTLREARCAFILGRSEYLVMTVFRSPVSIYGLRMISAAASPLSSTLTVPKEKHISFLEQSKFFKI